MEETFIEFDGTNLKAKFQDGPVKEFGKNGADYSELIEFLVKIYTNLNQQFGCRENALTITKLEEALHWQQHRTRDREARGVEGKNEA